MSGDMLIRNVRLVHGRDTCDDGGRPLSTSVCDYHQGFRDALDELSDVIATAQRVAGWKFDRGDGDTDEVA